MQCKLGWLAFEVNMNEFMEMVPSKIALMKKNKVRKNGGGE